MTRSLESLANQMGELEALCGGDVDVNTLNRLFSEIPRDQRQQLGVFE